MPHNAPHRTVHYALQLHLAHNEPPRGRPVRSISTQKAPEASRLH